MFPFAVNDKVDLAVKLSANEYMGKTQVSIQVKDIRLSAFDDVKVINSINNYEAFCRGGELDEAVKKALFVDREFCANIYRYVKGNNGWRFSARMLCYRLGFGEDKIMSCQIALDVLSELGIIIYKEGKYILPDENVKSSLENSQIFRRAVKERESVQ